MAIVIHKAEIIELRSILKAFKKALYSSVENSSIAISRLKFDERNLLAKVLNVQSIDPKLTTVQSVIDRLENITTNLERIRISSVIDLNDDLRLVIEKFVTEIYPVEHVLLVEYYQDKSLIAGFSFEAGGKYYDLAAKERVIQMLDL